MVTIQPHVRLTLKRVVQRLRQDGRDDAAYVARQVTGTIVTGGGGASTTSGGGSSGGGSLSGDVNGTLSSTRVGRIQGRAVSSEPPADGQALVYDGTSDAWRPGVPGASGIDYSGLTRETAPWSSPTPVWSASSTTDDPDYSFLEALYDTDDTSQFRTLAPALSDPFPHTLVGAWVEVDLGAARDITYFRLIQQWAQGWELQYTDDDTDPDSWSTAWWGSPDDYTLPEDTGIQQVSGGSPISARYWRFWVNQGPDDEALKYYNLWLATFALYSGSTSQVSSARKYAATVGDGATTVFPIAHGLGSRDCLVSVRAVATPYGRLDSGYTVAFTDDDTVTVTFSSAPSTDQYRVVVLG